jgi:hypothetical protein
MYNSLKEDGKTWNFRGPVLTRDTLSTLATGALLSETVNQLGKSEMFDTSFYSNTNEIVPHATVRFSGRARLSAITQSLVCSVLHVASEIAENSSKKRLSAAVLTAAISALAPSYAKHGIYLSSVNLPEKKKNKKNTKQDASE